MPAMGAAHPRRWCAWLALVVATAWGFNPPLAEPVEVVPGLYISSAASAANASLLASLGVRAVVNAAVSDGHGGPALEEAAYLPMELLDADCEAPLCRVTPDQFRAVSRFIASARALSHAALVHCRKGQSRSAALVLGHLIVGEGLTLREALALVRRRHPTAAPNHGLMRCLVELEVEEWGQASVPAEAYPAPILL